MSAWHSSTVAELCGSVDYGFTASACDDPSLPRFLRITDIAGDHLDWATVPGCVIDDGKLERFAVREGDIVVARTGATVGHAKQIRRGHPKSVFASYLVRFRPRDDIDPTFLGAVVDSQAYRDWVLNNAGGAAQPNANATTLGAFPVLVPDRPTQAAIGQIFSVITELIENNRRRIQILEEMAKAIYREWFVSFRFPGHNEMPFNDSALAPVPEGWKSAPIAELVEIARETVDAREVAPDLPAVGREHIPRRQLTLDSWGQAADLQSRKTMFRRDDILFGKIRPYFHKVSVAPLDGICSTDAIVIRPKEPYWGLVTLTVSSNEFVAHATQTATGTKMPRADWKVIGDYLIAVPPEGLSAMFNALVRSHFETARSLMFSVRKLARMRDLLLPKLVSGQIDVSKLELDSLVEATA
jgi:type I restriction enzyme S subunit